MVDLPFGSLLRQLDDKRALHGNPVVTLPHLIFIVFLMATLAPVRDFLDTRQAGDPNNIFTDF